eukprot:gene42538-29395_t
MLIDEVHTVAEDRGPVLEAVVSRMKTIRSARAAAGGAGGEQPPPLRFVAVSATLPNIDDLASWLDVDDEEG